MGMSLSTARWAAPLAYGINFVACVMPNRCPGLYFDEKKS